MQHRRPVTAGELLEMGSDAPFELVRGELRRITFAGSRASEVAATMCVRLAGYAEPAGLGRVTGAGCGDQVEWNPDTVIAVDGALLSYARHPAPLPWAYVQGAPDLALLVPSPWHDRHELALRAKWLLERGVLLVWLVETSSRSATVYRPGREPVEIGPEGELDGEDVVPGFRLPLAEVFA